MVNFRIYLIVQKTFRQFRQECTSQRKTMNLPADAFGLKWDVCFWVTKLCLSDKLSALFLTQAFNLHPLLSTLCLPSTFKIWLDPCNIASLCVLSAEWWASAAFHFNTMNHLFRWVCDSSVITFLQHLTARRKTLHSVNRKLWAALCTCWMSFQKIT